MQFWNDLEGRIVDGRYPLLRLTRSEGRHAWFETEMNGTVYRPGTIALTEALTDANEVTARLEVAKEVNDPHLVEILEIGKARVDGTELVYVLMERTDQNLSDVLSGQSLSTADTRQVAEALVAALTAIHHKGLTHGRVEPASIVAVGETVKLRSDCLETPGATREKDVAGVGATLFQALTQRKVLSAEDPAINNLPAPFGEIVRNSLCGRWTLPQVAMALKPPVSPSATVAKQAIPVELPKAAAKSAIPVSPRAEKEDLVEEDRERKPFYWALAAAVLLALILWFFFRFKPTPQPASPAPVPASSLATPADGGQANPAAATPVPSSPIKTVVGPEVSTAGPRSVWRVVAYTYHHEDQAQHKVSEILQQHPSLQVSILPIGHDTYLVTIGGPMDRSHALQLRSKAVGIGLPADTYAQNFSR